MPEGEKLLVIARSPPCAIDDKLKMGSKTIVILREPAVMRFPLPITDKSKRR